MSSEKEDVTVLNFAPEEQTESSRTSKFKIAKIYCGRNIYVETSYFKSIPFVTIRRVYPESDKADREFFINMSIVGKVIEALNYISKNREE